MTDASGAMSNAYCCDSMRSDLEHVCEQHPNRWDCPDALVGYWPERGEYGLIVHDGGSAMLPIRFCPWCGADLGRVGKRS